MVVTTPSGYKVTIKDFITFGQRRELERILISSTKVNPSTQSIGEINPSALYDAQDKAVELLVTEIRFPDSEKVVTVGVVEEIKSWREEDGTAVYEAINKITEPKKKVGEKK